MGHVFQISDEQYAKLAAYAAQYKHTPEALFRDWVTEVIHNAEKSASHNHKEQAGQEVQEVPEEEILNSPLFKLAGIFAIGEPGWADKHDEYLAEAYVEDHADE